MEETKEVISLLKEIKGSLRGIDISALSVALIAASSALAGTIITSIVQFLSSKTTSRNDLNKLTTQLKAELVSKQRQEWMDSIREKAADLLAEYDHVFELLTNKHYNNQDLLNQLHLSTSRKAIFIQLKLNPTKEPQKDVIDSIENLLLLFQSIMHDPSTSYDSDYDKCRIKYISSLNELFSNTWQRIKRLE